MPGQEPGPGLPELCTPRPGAVDFRGLTLESGHLPVNPTSSASPGLRHHRANTSQGLPCPPPAGPVKSVAGTLGVL